MSGLKDRVPMDVRFWRHVAVGDGCWDWAGSLDSHGYGRLSLPGGDNGNILAHRYSAMLHFGMFDRRTMVLHRCDNPACVRPDHLFLGTQTDNMRDMAAKGRSSAQRQTHCKHGHEFTPENTRISGRRQVRVCRTCARAEWQSRAVRHA